MSCRYCDRALLYGATTATQTVDQNEPIRIPKVLGAGVSSDGNVITIRRPGVYSITATASMATTGSSTTNMAMQIQNGGVSTGAVSTGTSSGNTSFVSLSTSAMVVVKASQCPLIDGAATISVVNTGGQATVSSATVIVSRI